MKNLFVSLLPFLLFSCSGSGKFDASGTFESDEVIVSAEQSGKLLSFTVNEGDVIPLGKIVGFIDVTTLRLQREQVQATIDALNQKLTDPQPQLDFVKRQLAVQQSNVDYLLSEQKRIHNLVQQDAATAKQRDDIDAQADAAQKQLEVYRQQITLYTSNIATQNRSITSERPPLQKQLAMVENSIDKGKIENPLAGTVLTKYAMEGEVVTFGKALYKIAHVDTLTLRAYVTGNQLPQLKLGDEVQVFVDKNRKEYNQYSGIITWISDKAEFTPKTIQTKDERAGLVYAIKVRVKNDGLLKIGMYGEVKFIEEK
ncbi:MAG: HlyD family efflux transporter periplasmic adaptor subunit [Prevotellaceae bacterium]|nr:HlyD family efflux transporter periplasmic adaptor subunit [Prevotellaceae bacterium]